MLPLIRPVARLLLAVLLASAAGTAFAQPPGGRPDRRQNWGGGRMSGEERQRFREDLQRQPQYVDPRRRGDPGGGRYAEWQRMSPEQREGIRRDMRDYNRDYDRRR